MGKQHLNAKIQQLEKSNAALLEQVARADASHVVKDAEILELRQQVLNLQTNQLRAIAGQVEANLRDIVKPAKGTRFNFVNGTFDAPEAPAAKARATKKKQG